MTFYFLAFLICTSPDLMKMKINLALFTVTFEHPFTRKGVDLIMQESEFIPFVYGEFNKVYCEEKFKYDHTDEELGTVHKEFCKMHREYLDKVRERSKRQQEIHRQQEADKHIPLCETVDYEAEIELQQAATEFEVGLAEGLLQLQSHWLALPVYRCSCHHLG